VFPYQGAFRGELGCCGPGAVQGAAAWGTGWARPELGGVCGGRVRAGGKQGPSLSSSGARAELEASHLGLSPEVGDLLLLFIRSGGLMVEG